MLPQYDQWQMLGCGGMGAVYQARQVSLDRRVAIKVLPPQAAEDEVEFVARFQNEVRTMAKVSHPAIVAVYDFGATSDELLYIVMEFIDGTDVAKMIQAQGRLTADHALAITAHVCDALAYAHEHGVVHRDIKPANVLINMEGAVKVADFGLARMHDPAQTSGLTQGGMTMGTPDFVAPEALIQGVMVDGRADLYAVGVMLYNMLTGEIPRGFFKLPSEKTGCDPRFDAIVRKAMEQDVSKRYQSAREIRHDLDQILTVPVAKAKTQPQRAAGMPPQQRPRAHIPPPPTKGMPWGLITAAVVALGSGAVFFILRGDSTAPPPKVVEIKAEPDKAPAVAVPDETKEVNTVPPAMPSMPVIVQTDPNAPKGSPLSKFPVLSHNGHHYQVVEQRMSFSSAVKHAESVGAHLATITSQEEQEWLESVMPVYISEVSDRATTLGAIRKDGVWRWVTGEPFEYTRWNDAHKKEEPEKTFVLKMTLGSEPVLGWGMGFETAGRPFLIEWDDTPKTSPEPAKPAMPAPPVAESEGAKRLRELETSFRAALERDVLAVHRSALADLNSKYLAALDRSLAAATAASNLPEALALRDEKLRIESSGPLPTEDAPELPATLKTLRTTYRTSLKPIDIAQHNGRITLFLKYEEVLKSTLSEWTKSGLLDDARLAEERLADIARERTGGVLADKELLPDGKELVLKRSERFTSPESFKPPVEFTIVAKVEKNDLRLAYTAKQLIFNWEVRPDELRLDADPGGGRHAPGQGRIPEDTFVTIRWRVMPHMQSISVDGARRYLHFGDYSKVKKPLEIFPLNTPVTVKSAKVRVIDPKSLEEQVSSVPEMKEILTKQAEWIGSLTIPAGTYRPLRRIDIGAPGKRDPKAQNDEQRCDVTSRPGMRMENVRFHLKEGSWKADGGLFREVKITADLGGSFEAKNCLFQDCLFAKEGPWYVAFFSSKWSFTNCVFTGSFMQNWKLGDVGMRLDGCTFRDVDFIPIVFKTDASVESAKDWLSIQNCRFINCRVPESFALATKNCVFEKCTFGGPEEIPVQTAFKTMLYLQDSVNQPATGPQRTIEAFRADQAPSNVGASLKHRLSGRTLDFE
jgi:serine/threonine protein kinase